MAKKAALFLLALAAARSGTAGSLQCGPESAPLIELSLADVFPGAFTAYGYVLCRDGRITLSRTLVGVPFAPRFGFSVARGRVPAATMKGLSAALAAARVSTLEDCNATGSVDGTLDLRFTWFGRGRRHTVVIRGGGIAEPRCSPQAVALRSSLFGLLNPELLQDAETIRVPSTIVW